jgi:hypothetical protein
VAVAGLVDHARVAPVEAVPQDDGGRGLGRVGRDGSDGGEHDDRDGPDCAGPDGRMAGSQRHIPIMTQKAF